MSAYIGSMKTIEYNRKAAVEYAKKWAYGRNPAYYNFDRLGGDCTNYVSQCLFAGGAIMNFRPVTGWYYRSANDRTAAWTGVEYLFKFLTENEGAGPVAEEIPVSQLQLGDLVQLGRGDGVFYHTPIVVGFEGGQPLVAAHTYNIYNKPLYEYYFERIRGIHIYGIHIPDQA